MESRKACVFAKQRDGQEVPLFEGGNPLPFFWLMLVGDDDIRHYSEKIKQASHTMPDDTSMALDKLKALAKATGRRNYKNITPRACPCSTTGFTSCKSPTSPT